MKRYYLTAALIGLLAGCGGGGSDGDSATGPGGNGTAQADAFISRVSSVIGSTSEEAEPVSIEDVKASENETAAPQPI